MECELLITSIVILKDKGGWWSWKEYEDEIFNACRGLKMHQVHLTNEGVVIRCFFFLNQ